MSSAPRMGEVAEVLAVAVPLFRDRDDDGAPILRVVFLNRVCALEELAYRRDTWPIVEIGASVGSDGAWRIPSPRLFPGKAPRWR